MNLIRDIRYAWRKLRLQPGFTAVAVVTLALGIGANTAIFSVVDAVLLRPLPYPKGDELFLLAESNAARRVTNAPVSPRTYRDWTAQSATFRTLGAYQYDILSYTGPDGAVRLNAATVTASLIPLLGVAPVAGRAFVAGDDDPSRPAVAMINERIWERQFGRDPSVIGRTVLLNTQPYVLIGVMPKTFDFPLGSSDAWTLVTFTPDQLQNRSFRTLNVVGRLKDGTTASAAGAEMAVISARLAQADPASSGWSASMVSLYEGLVANVRPSLLMLQGAVVFVLLIACVNVAALLSARMAVRQHEVGLRTALGASRSGLVRQLLTESLILGVAGGTGGVLLALWGLHALAAAIPAGSLPRADGIGLDGRVLAFTLAIALGTGLLFGLFPAVQSTRTALASVLGDSGRRTSAGRGQQAFRNALVVLEVVLSLVLLVGAGLLMRTFVALNRIDPGFRSKGVLVSSQLVLPFTKYGQDFRGNRFFRDLLERLERIPGIESAGGITALPLQSNSRTAPFVVVGEPPRTSGNERRAVFNVVAGDYFKTMGIPMKEGRLFTTRDDEHAPPVALVNDTLAKDAFGHAAAVGQHLQFGNPLVSYDIVGVVGSSRQFGLTSPPLPEVFTSYLAEPITYMYVLTKSAGDPTRFAPDIRREVRALDPDQPVGHRTLAQQFDNAIADSRLYTTLLGLFGATAMLLAAVGIYGVMSYVVAQRTREFGIRLALGADVGHVRALVIGLGLRLVGIGLVVGLGLAWLLTRYLGSLLYGVTTTDVATFATVAALLGAIGTIAGYVPARRAMRVAPLEALRAE